MLSPTTKLGKFTRYKTSNAPFECYQPFGTSVRRTVIYRLTTSAEANHSTLAMAKQSVTWTMPPGLTIACGLPAGHAAKQNSNQ